MGRDPEPERKVHHINIRLRLSEFDWLKRRASRLTGELAVQISPTQVIHGLVKRAMEEEPEA